MKRMLLLLIALAAGLLTVIVLDRTVVRGMAERAALPRYERMVYRTTEFSCVADINSEGFRDDEYAGTTPSGTYRIVTLGDSFTFGWAVEESNAWPRVLAHELRARGAPVEVLNLGKPGDSPAPYVPRAMKMLPRLRPDLVIVAILQGDDLAQLHDRSPAELAAWIEALPAPTARAAAPRATGARGTARAAVKALIPNVLQLRSLVSRTQTEPITSIWKKQAEALENGFPPDAKARLHALPEDLYRMFMSGNLNPALVRLSATNPGYFLETWDVEAPLTKDRMRSLTLCLARIKSIAETQGAEVIVAIVPYGLYVNQRSHDGWKRLGFDLVPEMLTQDNADEAIRRSAGDAGLSCISVQEDFRRRDGSEVLYYDADGHFTPAGQRLYAKFLADRLAPRWQRADTAAPRE